MSRIANRDKIVEDLKSRFAELAEALTDVLHGANLSGQRPLAMSRALGVDKNIAWKVAKLSRPAPLQAAFQLLPGEAGLEILLEAVLRLGATRQSADRARRAFRAVERV